MFFKDSMSERSARDKLLDVRVQDEAKKRLLSKFSGVRFSPEGFKYTYVDSRIKITNMIPSSTDEFQQLLAPLATVRIDGDHGRTQTPSMWLMVPNQSAMRFDGVGKFLTSLGQLGLFLLLLVKLAI